MVIPPAFNAHERYHEARRAHPREQRTGDRPDCTRTDDRDTHGTLGQLSSRWVSTGSYPLCAHIRAPRDRQSSPDRGWTRVTPFGALDTAVALGKDARQLTTPVNAAASGVSHGLGFQHRTGVSEEARLGRRVL